MKRTYANQRGFSMIELMIVVAIVSILTAIAIPNIMKARHKARANVCINNLRLIDGASLQWALEFKASDNTPVNAAQAERYLGHGSNGTMPAEPETGLPYTWPLVAGYSACPNRNGYYSPVYNPGNLKAG